MDKLFLEYEGWQISKRAPFGDDALAKDYWIVHICDPDQFKGLTYSQYVLKYKQAPRWIGAPNIKNRYPITCRECGAKLDLPNLYHMIKMDPDFCGGSLMHHGKVSFLKVY